MAGVMIAFLVGGRGWGLARVGRMYDFRLRGSGCCVRAWMGRAGPCPSPGRIKREKGVWWMPWQQEAMKDAIPCDKSWGAGNGLRSKNLRMGQPT